MIAVGNEGWHIRSALFAVVFLLVLWRWARSDPKDRVLLFECMGVGFLMVGFLLYRLFGLSEWGRVLVLVPTIACAVLALFYAIGNRLRRSKKAR
jgi:hypothetical protein